MIRSRSFRPILPAAALLLAAGPLLAGCSDLSRSFGFTRSSPDEFAVTTQPPLSMPPDYAIRPPEPGAPRPQAVPASRAAEQALIPQSALTGPGPAGAIGPGQQALVQSATAAAGAPPSGPQLGLASNTGDQSFARILLFGGPGGTEELVNAPAEAKRLRENAALGRSPVAGETPVIKPEQKGWLQRLF